MGTSTCHVMNGDRLREVPGMCGVVDGGITAGRWGYEAGQSGVGDIFGWFVDQQRPRRRTRPRPSAAGSACTSCSPSWRPGQAVGEHGLIALDWHSGNRSVLVDHDLSGVIVGQTLATRPEDIYRALIEATAFGTRTIVETFNAAGVPVTELVVAGGLLKNRLLMQIYADVLNLPLSLATSEQAPALGSAIHAAVAAGAYPDVAAAAAVMGALGAGRLHPGPGQRRRLRRAVRGVPDAARLLRPRRQPGDAPAAGAPAACVRRPVRRAGRRRGRGRGAGGGAGMTTPGRGRGPGRLVRREVAELHAELTRNGLVVWTAGNVSARVRGADLFVIKPSGVSYDELTPDNMVVCDLDGNLVEGDHAPSSDTAAHAYVYRHLPEVGGVVHTHSTYATAWAARGEPIPCVLTMMADEFGGEIPVGPFALIGDDSIGRGIVETLRRSRSRAVLMQQPRPVHRRHQTPGPPSRRR